jgi:hypothetical protein
LSAKISDWRRQISNSLAYYTRAPTRPINTDDARKFSTIGLNGGLDLVFQIGGVHSIQLALMLLFRFAQPVSADRGPLILARLPQKNVLVPRFFLRFSLLDVP